MTLQGLSKILDQYDKQLGSSSIPQFELLKGLSFYNWSPSERYVNGLRDFNHAIGLPLKNGIQYPLFDYEQMLYSALQSNRHIWILKATGLGITEFMLRLFDSKETVVEINGVHIEAYPSNHLDAASCLSISL